MITEQHIDTQETVTSVMAESIEAARKMTRAMKVLSDVARIYKKYGTSATWHPIEPAYTEPKRATRIAQQAVQTGQAVCGRCGLPYVARALERCQCKVAVKRKRHS